MTEITLVWQEASGAVSEYSVELTKNQIVSPNYTITAAHVSQLTITGLSPGDRFSIRVRAFDDQSRFGPYFSALERSPNLRASFLVRGFFLHMYLVLRRTSDDSRGLLPT